MGWNDDWWGGGIAGMAAGTIRQGSDREVLTLL